MKKPQSKKPPFSFETWGTFGIFQSGSSLPVHYVLTTINISQLGELTLARNIRPEKIDFELLMQRDIDVDRVNSEIIKYLKPDASKKDAEILSRPLFFPPLLVAVIPVVDKAIKPYLPDEVVVPIELDGSSGVKRSWGDVVNLNFYIADDGDGFHLTDDDGAEHCCQYFPVQLQVRRPPENSNVLGARLVVFDGQHRYEALRKLAGTGLLKSLSIPLCIVLSPNSTQKHADAGSNATLPVPDVFRTLFVDVNKNAVSVGGHFQTLLSDSSIGSIACRVFCESVLSDENETGLAVVEWNVRAKKDATQIKGKYSLTSIGVIEQALTKSLSHKRDHSSLLKYVLALEDVSDLLYPKESTEDVPKVEWDRFTPSQRHVLEVQIRERLVKQGLQRLFFETQEFSNALGLFRKAIAKYQQSVANKEANFEINEAVLQEVLEYVPIPDDAKVVRASIVLFQREIEGLYETDINPIIRYGIFQRGMISAWVSLIAKLRASSDFDLNSITSGFIVLLDWVLDRKRAVFSERTQRYVIYSIFRNTGQIKPTDSARDAVACLILAGLGNKAVASSVIQKALGHADVEHEASVIEIGLNAATRFAGIYRKERLAEFSRSYRADFNIPREDREALYAQEQNIAELKRKLRDSDGDVSEYTAALEKFNAELSARVSKEVDIALVDLKAALEYEGAVIEAVDIEDVESEE
jgi:hypothetical protein